MIRVALVEDEADCAKMLREYLERYETERDQRLRVSVFSDGDEIALGYKGEYDIILMDIEMRFMDGMTAAEEIRRSDPEVIIIFITHSPQYAIKGYAVNALDYVLKPVNYFAFSQRMDRAVERLQKRQREYLNVSLRGGVKKLDMSEIYFVEVQDHDLRFHTAGGVYTTNGAMKEVERTLPPPRFFRCHKGYLVNLEHVTGVREDSAVVHGELVQVSRARKRAFLDALNNYLGEVGR